LRQAVKQGRAPGNVIGIEGSNQPSESRRGPDDSLGSLSGAPIVGLLQVKPSESISRLNDP
jgi:hypothetical protein